MPESPIDKDVDKDVDIPKHKEELKIKPLDQQP
jgi:hypothetical protein